MDQKILSISLFGACTVRSSTQNRFEITGAKHKALFALLATAPFGKRTRSFLQETLWGTACYDTGRQSLRRALADIKSAMGDDFTSLLSTTNSDVTLDLNRVEFLGRAGGGLFLEGLDIKERGFLQWLDAIRSNPAQIHGLFSVSVGGMNYSILPSVAVLPFRSLEGEGADVVIGDWLAEEVCRSLSRSRLLNIISHLSCRELARGIIDIQSVQKNLRADYCVTGSMRRSGQTMIVDADFIDVRTGRILWTRQVSAPIQGFINSVDAGISILVNSVGSAIADDALSHISGRRLNDIEDHRLVTAGVKLMNRSTLHDQARARELLEEAIRRSPNMAESHSWLGKWHILSVFNGWSINPREETKLAVDCTARALDLSPDNAFCLTMDGFAQNNLLRRLDLAEQRYASALAINPNEALSWLLHGTLKAFRDDGKGAVFATERARRLSPIDPFKYFYDSLSATACLADETYDQALALAESSLALNDRHISTLRTKIVALHNLGRKEELLKAGELLMRRTPEFSIKEYLASHPAADFQFGKKAAAAFRAAGIPQ